MLDVVGIGNAIVDVLAEADEALLKRHRLTKGSMTLVDAERAETLYREMGGAVERSGGSAANTMVGLASLGGRSGYVGKVKDDPLGEVFARDLAAEGVRFATPRASAGPPTGRCLILVTPDAERTMQTFLGASGTLTPADVDPELIEAGKILYLEGYLWDAPPAKEAMRKAAEIAHRAGRKVALSLSDSFCVDRHRAEFLQLLGGDVDYLFANQDEALALFQTARLDEAVSGLRGRCALAAITRGAGGSTVVTPGGGIEIAAHPPTALVDTTGAGDLYAAGFLYGLARGLDPARAGELGARSASQILGHFGSRPLVPLRRLVE